LRQSLEAAELAPANIHRANILAWLVDTIARVGESDLFARALETLRTSGQFDNIASRLVWVVGRSMFPEIRAGSIKIPELDPDPEGRAFARAELMSALCEMNDDSLVERALAGLDSVTEPVERAMSYFVAAVGLDAAGRSGQYAECIDQAM